MRILEEQVYEAHLTATLLLSSRLLLLRTRLVGVESGLLDGCRGVVRAGLAVLVGLGLEGVFVLGVFAGEADWSLGERSGGGDERGARGAGGEEGAAEGGEEHRCGPLGLRLGIDWCWVCFERYGEDSSM